MNLEAQALIKNGQKNRLIKNGATFYQVWNSMRCRIRFSSHTQLSRLNPVTNPGPSKRSTYLGATVQGCIIVVERNSNTILYISTTKLCSIETYYEGRNVRNWIEQEHLWKNEEKEICKNLLEPSVERTSTKTLYDTIRLVELTKN